MRNEGGSRQGGRMIGSFSAARGGSSHLSAEVSSMNISAQSSGLEISNSGMQIAIVVGTIAILALIFAFVLRRQVLEIGRASSRESEWVAAVVHRWRVN